MVDPTSSPSHSQNNDPPNRTGMLVGRMVDASERGVALIIRQSSAPQKTGNIGSGYFQWDQIRHLEAYGIERSDVDIIDLRGETGRADADRPGFEGFLQKVRAGLYGVIIITFADRAARNQRDTDRLVEALREVNGMLVVNGRIYDPTDPGHRLILGILAQIAQHDNEMRVLRSLTSKAALAHRLALAIPLPTGLVWASPEDPSYMEALRRAEMEHVVSEEALDAHQATATIDGRDHYVLPLPDQEVQQALQLLSRWLLETRDLGTVLRRIGSGEGDWPRAGRFPSYGSRRFDPGYLERRRAEGTLWQGIVGREDGKDDQARGKVREFLGSPALYGTYAYRCDGLATISRAAADISEAVRVEGAFPGLYDREIREELQSVLSEALNFQQMGSYDGPRHHAVPVVRCASFLPDGSRCRLKKSPVYRPRNRGRFRYKTPGCRERGHSSDCADQLDDVVLALVSDVYSEDPLRKSLRRVRQSRSRTDQERKRLQRKLAEAEGRIESAAAKAESARTEGDRTLEKVFDRRVKKHHKTFRLTRRKLRELQAREGDEDLAQGEKNQLLDLARDVPRLLEKVRTLEGAEPTRHEGAVRRLLAVLINQVHVRRLGAFCHHVQVEFPSGATRDRVLFSRQLNVPQASLAFAYSRLGDHATPEYRDSLEREHEVRQEAKETAMIMNEAAGSENLRTAWTGARVLAAALAFANDEQPNVPAQQADTWGVADLSKDLELDLDRILGAVLGGKLGAARIAGEDLRISPSEAQLHDAFPECARTLIARQQGWSTEDTVLVASFREERGLSWSEAKRLTKQGGGIVRDEAGRRWCRRPPEDDQPVRLEQALNRHLPADVNPDDGTWQPLKDVLREFGVHRATAKKYGTVVRPGFGYLGDRSVYIWVDSELRAKLT